MASFSSRGPNFRAQEILASTEAFGLQALSSPHVHPTTAVPFAYAEKIKKYISSQASPTATIVFRGTVIGSTSSSPRMASFSSCGPNFRAPEILASTEAFGLQALSSPHVHPTTAVPFAYAEKIKKYISSQVSPTATIVFRGTVIGSTPPSPRMASFSSCGPNFYAPEILASTEAFGLQALSSPHVHPTTAVPFAYAEKIKKYISSQASPTATIVFRGTVIGSTPPSPRMAYFSSCGPNFRAPEILASTEAFGLQALSSPHVHPTTAVPFAYAEKIKKYISSQASPTATILFRGTVIGSTLPSPRMASFSSRGPNFRAPEILASTEAFGLQALSSPHVHPTTAVPFAYAEKIKKYISSQASPTATIVFRGTVIGSTPPSPRMASFSSRGLNFHAPEILASTEAFGLQALSSPHVHPTMAVPFAYAEKIKKYISSQASPTATIVFRGTVIGSTPPSPRMASFSSRGPNFRAPEILASTEAFGLQALRSPHVHPTTAVPFAYAEKIKKYISSQVSPTATIVFCGTVIGSTPPSPRMASFSSRGLNFRAPEILKPDIPDWCTTPEQRITSLSSARSATPPRVAVFDPAANCSTRAASSVGDHNYPAFSVVFTSNKLAAITQRRVVRNVGDNVSATYRARVTSPAGVRVTVRPGKLQFSAKHKTQEYEITFAQRIFGSVTEKHTFGSIVWSDGEKHTVTSPIAITWPVSQDAEM
ncbi:hypothetical protein ACQ4PT_026385 [Festuca glaucescens]